MNSFIDHGIAGHRFYLVEALKMCRGMVHAPEQHQEKEVQTPRMQ